jgi:hypothetical protein
MLGPVRFRLENGEEFQPMHAVSWDEEVFDPAATGGFSHLFGEWPCIPFGTVAAPRNLPAGWASKAPDGDNCFHGFAAHHDWQLQDEYPGFLSLTIQYPETSSITSLERTIQADPASPSLTVTLRINVRRKVAMPVALHATFRVPKTPGSLQISSGNPAQVMSYPCSPEPTGSRLRPDTHSHSLSAIEGTVGPLDLSRLPLPFPAEDVLQLVACREPICLRYVSENAMVLLDWDHELLPDALLWISNGGRARAPWNGRHFALGVEPLIGPFDLGRVATPPADHPLVNRLLELTPERRTTIRYQLTARSSFSDL